jgi:hypothetical protein
MKKEILEKETLEIIKKQKRAEELFELGAMDEGNIVSYDDLEEKPE